MSWQFLIVWLGLLPMLIILGLLTWQIRRMDADERREAITTELRNLPATSLQKQREELVDRQLHRMFAAIIIGLITVTVILSRRVKMDLSNWGALDSIATLIIVGTGIYYGLRMIREMPQGRRLRQAIRAEQATAQELSTSLAGNNRIIHDVQAGDFNIDHVVISPVGIFAIETKSRLKPPAGNGSPKVKYDGKSLDFGTWTETKPIDQAARQARWLASYLQQSTGNTYPVFAVLSLPGWYIENATRVTDNMVRVINPKKSDWLFLPIKQPERLDPSAIQRAAFQIEKLAQVETG